MRRLYNAALPVLMVAVSLVVAGASAAFAADRKDMGGWETGSTYNQKYDSAELDRIKGIVTGIREVTPMKGMAPGIALLVKEAEDETTLVHLCPAWFIGRKDTGIRKGDKVKVKGCWTEIEGEDVFMASKVKKGDYFELKVRLTKNGTPFWTMTPEELERERKGK